MKLLIGGTLIFFRESSVTIPMLTWNVFEVRQKKPTEGNLDTPKLTWNVFEVRQKKIKFVFPYVVLFQQMRLIIHCGRLHNHNTVHQSLQN